MLLIGNYHQMQSVRPFDWRKLKPSARGCLLWLCSPFPSLDRSNIFEQTKPCLSLSFFLPWPKAISFLSVSFFLAPIHVLV